jgi:hypothetical protein
MKLKQRYFKVFSKKKSEVFIEIGYKFLYEANGVYWFEDDQNLTAKFSDNKILKDTKVSTWIPL